MKIATPPGDLKAAGKTFWRKIHGEFVLDGQHDLERLGMACRCLDDLTEAEDRVRADGMFQVNRYGNTIEHPGMKVIRDMRLLFVRIIRELGLDLTNGPESRPPRRY